MAKLREFLRLVDRSEKVLPDTTYRQIGVRVWGKGAYERETIAGRNTKYKDFSRVRENDIIVNKIWARNGSVAIVTKELSGLYCSGEFPLFVIDEKKAYLGWIKWLIKTPWFWNQCAIKSGGTSGKNRITPTEFLEIEVELPSLEKQLKEADRLDKSAPTISELGTISKETATHLQKLRQSILQEAVMGKLAPHNPNDEPASELLNKIKAEKEKLTKKGKVRKEKPLPPVTKEEIPYELPKGWEWTRIGDIFELMTGATPSTGVSSYWDGNIRWLRSGDVNKGEIFECDGRISESGLDNSNCKLLPKDSVLIALNGQGKTRGTTAMLRIEAACNQSIVALVSKDKSMFNPDYLNIFLKANYMNIRDITGHKQRRGLNMGIIEMMVIALPPYLEQKQIVEKINNQLKLCNELEIRIEENEKNSELLIESVLREAFEAN